MSRVFAALVILGLLVGAVPASAQTGRVQGQIVDTAGKPIKGVVVKATNGESPFDLTTTTDDKGRFALIGFRAGLWNFSAEAPGYEPANGQLPVRAATAGPPLRIVLRRALAPLPGALSGDITNQINMAEALRTQGRFEQALAAYQSIATKNPKVTTLHLVLGDLYRRRAEQEQDPASKRATYEKAITAYAEALKGDTPVERAKLEMGLVQVTAGLVDDGVRTLQELAASQPGTSLGRAASTRLAELRR